MKFLDILLPLFWVAFGSSKADGESPSTFSAVTRTDNLTKLYLRMRIREPHLEPDPKVDAETKKRICRSVMSSGHFDKSKIGAVDMDKEYKKLKSKERKQEERHLTGTRHIYHQKVLEDYEETSSSGILGLGARKFHYTYRTRLIPFSSADERHEEFAFACLGKHRETGELYVYYVSDAYNINAALDATTDRRVSARFICAAYWDTCNLEAVAEEPATAFTNVENVYLRMRQFYDHASASSDDPVCGQSMSEKLRVCASVMNSSFFVNIGDMMYMPHVATLRQECDLNEVSFRTDDAKAEAKNGAPFHEWMLRCTGVVSLPKGEFYIRRYFVSRAYQSHHAVVYSYAETTKTWSVENISANISVIVEGNLKIREERASQIAPNLDELLQGASKV